MTRDEFYESITTWEELKDFCYDNDCELLSDVYSDDARDSEIDGCLENWASRYSWYELRDKLDNIDTGSDWWLYDEDGEWIALGDREFDSYRDDVASWMDDNGYWDDADDEDEEYDEEPAPYVEEEPAPEDDDMFEDDEEPELSDEDSCSFADMLSASHDCIRAIREEALDEARAAEQALTEMISTF